MGCGNGFRVSKKAKPSQKTEFKRAYQKSYVTMLLCLLKGQRCQTVHPFDIEYIQKLPDMFPVIVRELWKYSRPGKHQEPFTLPAFSPDEHLRIVEHLSAYISKTEEHRVTNNIPLLISYIKLDKPVDKSTVARWIKSVLRESGTDVSRVLAHYCT